MILVIIALSTGCNPASDSATESTLAIAPPENPYQAKTNTPVMPTATAVIATEAPLLPTPTPFIHEVQPGDTLYGIAIQYNISIDKLVEANLGVDTSLLSIGTELIIPITDEEDQGAPTPTPYPITIEQAVCYPTRNGDLWCLAMVRNDQDLILENITAAFNIYDGNELIRSQVAITPINYLYPGQSIPVSGLIPDAKEGQYQVSAVLLTALPSEKEEPLVEIIDYTISYSLENSVATISGVIKVNDVEKIDHQIWIAAIGLNQGNPVGIRKWVGEEYAITSKEYPFVINLYSLGPRIDQVQLYSELY
jgi:LysM repeat protein